MVMKVLKGIRVYPKKKKGKKWKEKKGIWGSGVSLSNDFNNLGSWAHGKGST